MDHHDLDNVAEAKEEIIHQVKSMEGPEKVIESPISAAIDLDALRKSENPEKIQLAEISELLRAIGRDINNMMIKIDDQERKFKRNIDLATAIVEARNASWHQWVDVTPEESAGGAPNGAKSTKPIKRTPDPAIREHIIKNMPGEITEDDKG